MTENGSRLDAGLQAEVRPDRSGPAGNVIVITGPSGVGKGTVVEKLVQRVPHLVRSVSVTTRSMRPGEKEGRDYFFVSPQEFERRKAEGSLLESAEFAGCQYGTPRAWVEARLRGQDDVLLVLEVQGAMQVRQRMPEAVLVFLSPPSLAELEARLTGRGTEGPEKIALRLDKARQELAERRHFHYEVVNDDLDAAVDNLAHIIYAERLRIRNSAR